MKTFFLGRLTQEPSLKYLQNGNPVLSLKVATDIGYGDNKKTFFVSIAVWGKRAESLSTMLQKGSEYLFEVVLSDVKSYLRKDGTAGAELSFTLQDLKFTHGSKSTSRNDGDYIDNNFASRWGDEIPF